MSKFDFWNDFGNSFALPFTTIYNGFHRVEHVGERIIDIGDRVGTASGEIITATGDIASSIGNVVSGRSNLLLYVGIAIVAVIVLPKVVDKLL